MRQIIDEETEADWLLSQGHIEAKIQTKALFLQSPFFKDHTVYNYSHIQSLISTLELQKD